DQGTRRYRENIEILCIPGDPDPDLDCGKLVGPTLSAREFLAASGVCEGDSGSSAFEEMAFMAGQYVTLGVLSRGGANASDTACVDAVYTRLDAWAGLVVDTAKKAAADGNYALAAWATMPLAVLPAPDAGAPTSDAAASDAAPPDAQADGGSSLFPLGHSCG